ncbi:hypothetical protein HYY75_09700, partial [bacterium]|nr:hypothetical protein [bacterium]
VNLDPIGDGGLPDIRGMARVKDPVRLMSITPSLKQLATNLGVFVSTDLEKFPTVKLSYFLFPGFGVYIGLSGDLLLFSSYREGIIKLEERIQGVTLGRIPAYKIPEGVQRYWRIAFQRLNPQLQRFLQSPLFANKGIPPISNLTITNELGDMVLSTRILASEVEISVSLPLVSPEKK